MSGMKGLKRLNQEAIKTLTETDSFQLGEYVKEYLIESEHNSWDGWEDWKRDLTGAKAMIRDMALGLKHYNKG